MDLDQLKQILTLVRQHELSEFEIEQDGLRLKIRRDPAGGVPPAPAPVAGISAVAVPSSGAAGAVAAPVGLGGPSAVAVSAPDGELELAVVKSPIVGTFYRSAEPDSPPFVEVGTTVKKGQVLCIIEAMKLMNEIDSEHDGEIANVYVENGQPVQYGERLFAIRTK